MKLSRLERLYQTQNKAIFLQSSSFNIHSSNSIFQLLFQRFFRQIAQFQVVKNLLKKSEMKLKNFDSFWKNEFGALIF
eukprot:UN16704